MCLLCFVWFAVTALEIWGAEYQENNAFLVWPGDAGWDLVRRIAQRENCPVAAVGAVTGVPAYSYLSLCATQ
jgi:phosphoribosylformylglycinamidine (FGAM) synthase-like enzyme